MDPLYAVLAAPPRPPQQQGPRSVQPGFARDDPKCPHWRRVTVRHGRLCSSNIEQEVEEVNRIS